MTIEEIFKENNESIFRFCYFRTNSREDAEDITSYVFSQLIEKAGSDLQNERAWLYTTARNALKNYYRDSKKMEEYEEEDYSEVSVEKQALDDETVKAVEEDLRQIDPKKAEVIILRLWDEMSFSEISEVIQESQDTAKKRYSRGLKELQLVQKKKEKRRVFGILPSPILLGGVMQIIKQPVYAMPESLSTSLQEIIINKSTMESTSNVANATNGGTTGMMSTPIAKWIIVTAVSLALIGFVVGILSMNNNGGGETKPPVEREEPVIVEDEEEECELGTYTNENYPNFSFEYDSCEWELFSNISNSDNINLNLELTNNDQDQINIKVNPTASYGGGECYEGELTQFSGWTAMYIYDSEYNLSISTIFIPEYLERYYFLPSLINYGDTLNSGREDTDFCSLLGIVFITDISEELKSQEDPNLERLTYSYGLVEVSSNNLNEGVKEIIKSMTWEAPQGSETESIEDNVSTDCLETYTNENYPDFSFEYDSCEWDFVQTSNALILSSENTEINFNLMDAGEANIFPTTGNFFNCGMEFVQVKNGIYRYMIEGQNYYDYDLLGANYKTANDPNFEGVEVCGETSPFTFMESSIPGTRVMLGVTVESMDEVKLLEADEIIRTMTW